MLTGEPGMWPWEFTFWRAYDRIDPLGEERRDLAAGIVAATMANCHRSKDTEPYKPGDFMWQYKGPGQQPSVPEQSPEEVMRLVEACFGPAKPPLVLPPADTEGKGAT